MHHPAPRHLTPWLLAFALGGCATHSAEPTEYPDGRGIEGQLEREIIALRQTVAYLRKTAKTCEETGVRDPLFAELHQVLSPTGLEIDHRGGGTVVVLPADDLFARDGLRIRDEAAMTLDLLATALNLHDDYEVTIKGHTDDRPVGSGSRFKDNWEYSFARALAVARELVDKYGVAERRLHIQGRAHFESVASNDTPSGQARNRRVVIHIRPPEAR